MKIKDIYYNAETTFENLIPGKFFVEQSTNQEIDFFIGDKKEKLLPHKLFDNEIYYKLNNCPINNTLNINTCQILSYKDNINVNEIKGIFEI